MTSDLNHPRSQTTDAETRESQSEQGSEWSHTPVDVPLGDRSYRIVIGSATGAPSTAMASEIFAALPDISHALLVADDAVHVNWADPLADAMCQIATKEKLEFRLSRTTVASGEPSKSVAELERLWHWMLDEGTDRRSVVIAVGGGVVGDLAGFAAATFTRGLRFVQVPTTLLAMVDSSVGGKTGINLPTAKNMVGAFWQPSLVLIETNVLATLPRRTYLSGLAEIVKVGVIDDTEFFAWLEGNAAALAIRQDEPVRYAIQKSCESKARVVGEDERETSGRRAILNYGHTFAHAIEATAGYGTLLHGEAVAIGMQMAAHLAVELNMCDRNLLDRQTALLEACQLPTHLEGANPDDLLPVMSRDKKVAHGKLRFILPTAIGTVKLVGDIDPAAVREAIQACAG